MLHELWGLYHDGVPYDHEIKDKFGKLQFALERLERVALSKDRIEPTGTCDKTQYEHQGSHEQIFEHGQKLPPFPCENWKPEP